MESFHKSVVLCVGIVALFILAFTSTIASCVNKETQTMTGAGCSYQFNPITKTMGWDCPKSPVQ